MDDALKAKLREPVKEQFIAERKGLSYVSHRYVKSRMNQLFGPDGWQYRIVRTGLLDMGEGYVLWRTHVEVTVFGEGDSYGFQRDGIAVGHGTWKEGSSRGRINEVIDFAAAESVTDAVKRACIGFGETLGLSLYPVK